MGRFRGGLGVQAWKSIARAVAGGGHFYWARSESKKITASKAAVVQRPFVEPDVCFMTRDWGRQNPDGLLVAIRDGR